MKSGRFPARRPILIIAFALLTIAAIAYLLMAPRPPITQSVNTKVKKQAESEISHAPPRFPYAAPSSSSSTVQSRPHNSGYTDPDIEVSSFQPPYGRYQDAIPGLRALAEAGDAKAAYSLSRLLLDCYEAQVKGNPSSSYGSDEDGRCSGLSVTDAKEALRWLQYAASKGLVDAQVLFPLAAMGEISPTDAIRDPSGVQATKDQAVAYLSQAAAKGSANAMLQLSNIYFKGILANENMQMAYAYLYAANALHPEWDGDDPVDLYGGNLSTEQIAKAKLASEILLNTCCR